MKNKLTLIFFMASIFCCYWIFAHQKLQYLFEWDIGSTIENYEESPTLLHNTTSTPLSNGLIFAEDFESPSNWVFINSGTNEWHIGNAVQNGGTQSLYISNDSGVSNDYSNSLLAEEISITMSPSFTVPTVADKLVVSFDWRCVGSGSEWWVSDAFAVWLVPASYMPPKNKKVTPAGSGGLLLFDALYGQSTFKKENYKVDLTKYAGTPMRILFQWVNDSYDLKPPPAAIDNIAIYEMSCTEPTGLTVSNITLDEATVTWTSPNSTTTDFELYLALDDSYPSGQTNILPITNKTSHTFTNLDDSTYYYVWYRSVCSTMDKSFWIGPIRFMTQCGVFKTPFYETFDTNSLNVECWSFLQNNPLDKDSFQLSTIYKMEGDRGLMFQSYAKGVEHNSYAITPTLDVKGGLYKLTYYYKTSPSGGNEFSVLLSTTGKKASDFTTTLVARQFYQKSSYVQETVFFQGITGQINIAWHVSSIGNSTFHLENVRLEEVGCSEPLNLSVTDIKTDNAKLNWNDNFSTEWEYAVVNANNGVPTTTGIKTTQTSVVGTIDEQGKLLTQDTYYDFYVRAKCLDDTFGEWMGPIRFKTACVSKQVPYSEGFDTMESDFACWTILDVNNDGSKYSDVWKQSEYTVYKGDRCMSYSGSAPENDDWLISPGFNLNGGLYAITFYYQLDQNTTANLEVKVSSSGIEPSAFTQTIGTTLPYKGAMYTKKVVYVENITGVANIGFHITGKRGLVQLDEFSIAAVTCRAIDDLEITSTTINSASIKWVDDTNTTWQYSVQPASFTPVPPIGAGTTVNTQQATFTRVNGTNAALVPNTEYEVYVRSICGTGKYSEWIGPLKFRTQCEIVALPYREGFNSDSQSLYCWKVVDGNNDAPWYGGYGFWFPTDLKAYEGDQSMYFTNMQETNNDWLMSPLFKFEKSKIYRITYMYRTYPGSTADFEVRWSNTGREIANFTNVLLPKNTYDNVPWKKQKLFVSGIEGEVSIAFYVSNFKNWNSDTFIDDFYIEEVTTCTEPLTQGADNITGTSADIFWDNDYGTTEWEYFVRKKAFLVAPPLNDGTSVKNNKVTVTKDNFGANLEGNTWYEFYVRTKCTDGSKTEWTGPHYFRTDCTYDTLPYWEGFNGSDNSYRCWTIVDGNSDKSVWKQNTSNVYEGSHAVSFSQSGTAESDDWFISPLFKNLDPTKTYRVKFHYKGTGSGTNDMEVLYSTNGVATVNFTNVIASKTSYSSAQFKPAIYYFTGVSGDFNLGFHVVGAGAKNIAIDNLYIDEVVSCGQPLNLDVKNITGTQATLFWDDNASATEWEYMVHETKQIAPTAKDHGTVTKLKDFSITQDSKGNALKPNMDYVYYVRTVCANGKYSEWSGPVSFSTPCSIYSIPYETGFNTNTSDLRCWTIAQGPLASAKWSPHDIWPYEGDQLMQYNQTDDTLNSNSYLISPTIQFTPGNYVLKYYYKTDTTNNNEFEVLLSTNGTALVNFDKTLVAKKMYNNDNYIQEVVFITGVTGNVNIAWHAVGNSAMTLGIDKVTIEKAASCPEPYNVKVTDYTANTIDVVWDAQPGITSWEVFITEYGNLLSASVTGITVTGTPAYTFTGLTSGKGYSIYVRAKCAGNTGMSNWSTPIEGPTKVTDNGDCIGALRIPVNTGLDCIQKLGVSTIDATPIDTSIESNCYVLDEKKQLWFTFTATSTSHLLAIDNLIEIGELTEPSIAFDLYSGDCTTLNTTHVTCNKFEGSYGSVSKDDKSVTLNNLTPGHTYYIRFKVPIGDFMFTICMTTPEYSYVTVSKNGDKYTTEELVKDILIQSDCDLVSNVKYQAGETMGGNSLGYFNRNGSTFPFEEGIVLATHNIANTPGPYYDYGDAGGFMGVRGKIPEWEGDPDLNAVIASAGGRVYDGNKSVSILEFDFIPVKDTIKFEYLMASESYLHTCTVVCWGAGSLFAAWLTELETGQGQNLALVPGTRDPITLSTVRDTDRSGADCDNANPEFFGSYFGNGQENPLEAPINYIGMTKPMSSEPVYVKPGTKYRIKLAMADFCNTNHVSAVFFNAKSFDLGTLDLGADLTVEANTAVCSNEAKVIKSGLLTENVEISWMRDDVLIPGANQPDLEVTTAGQYKVIANYPAIDCEVIGTINVEMFTPLHEIIKQAKPIEYCRYVLGGVVVDLTEVESAMFKGLDRDRFNVTYYATEEDAVNAENAITVPEAHAVDYSDESQKRYLFIEDTVTGCTEVFAIDLVAVKGAVPAKPEDVKVCNSYEFPSLPSNQSYYAEAGAQGATYKVGDQLIQPGSYTIYIVQDNGGGCYEETSYTIDITAGVVADELSDKTYTCTVHTLEPLSEGNRYFTLPNGKGMQLLPGQVILNTQTIYIYVESEDKLCTDESSFTITYEECPIQKGVSPNGDGLNDTFDLSSNGVTNVKIFNRLGVSVYEFDGLYTNQWIGQNKGGKPLPSGTYYYVVVARGEVKTGWVQLSY